MKKMPNTGQCNRPKSSGFTLVELLVAIVIITGVTAWTLPRLNHKIQQSHVDTYTQNLETGMFGLMARVRKSAKYCTLFKNESPDSLIPIATYADPNQMVELSQINSNNRNQYIDCPCTPGSSNCSTPFRFLHKEQTREANLVQIQVSKSNYGLSPQGTNPEGDDLIMRVRSKQWSNNPQVLTRCLVLSGNGHLFKGTWDYGGNQLNASACKKFCPINGNCNG